MQCRLFLGYRVDIAYHAQKEFTPPFISNVKYLYEASKRTQRQDVIQKVIAEYPAAPAFFQLSMQLKVPSHFLWPKVWHERIISFLYIAHSSTLYSTFTMYLRCKVCNLYFFPGCPQCHNTIKCLSLLSQS